MLEEVIERMCVLVDQRARPGQLEVPYPVLGMYHQSTIPIARAIFKDVALREQCVVETIWMG